MPDYKRVNAEHSLKKAAVQIKAASEKLSYTGMFILLFFIFMRSTIHTGLSTYLPLFFMKFRGSEAIFASALVSAFLLGGVAGTYTGAVLSDRLGARRIILGSIILRYSNDMADQPCRNGNWRNAGCCGFWFFYHRVVCYNYRFSADDAA